MSMNGGWESTKAKLLAKLGAGPAPNAERLAGDFTEGESEYHGIMTNEEQEIHAMASQKSRRRMLMGAGMLMLVAAAGAVAYGSFSPAFAEDDLSKSHTPKPMHPPPPSPFPPHPMHPPPPSPLPPKHAGFAKKADATTSLLDLQEDTDAVSADATGDDGLDLHKKAKFPPPSPAPPPGRRL